MLRYFFSSSIKCRKHLAKSMGILANTTRRCRTYIIYIYHYNHVHTCSRIINTGYPIHQECNFECLNVYTRVGGRIQHIIMVYRIAPSIISAQAVKFTAGNFTDPLYNLCTASTSLHCRCIQGAHHRDLHDAT